LVTGSKKKIHKGKEGRDVENIKEPGRGRDSRGEVIVGMGKSSKEPINKRGASATRKRRFSSVVEKNSCVRPCWEGHVAIRSMQGSRNWD